MIEPAPVTPEDVQVGEPSRLLVTAPAHAQVHDQAVGDPRDPIGMDRVGQDDRTLHEIDLGVILEDLEAIEQVVLEEDAVAVEEEEEIAGRQRRAQVAGARPVGRLAAEQELIARPAPGVLLQHRAGRGVRTIIDDDDLHPDALALGLPAQEVDGRVDALEDLPGVLGLVGDGNDDRQLLHTRLLFGGILFALD